MFHVLTPERYCDEQVITFPMVAGAMPDIAVGTWVKPKDNNWDVYMEVPTGEVGTLLCAPLILKTKRPDSGSTAVPGVANPAFSFTGQVETAVVLRNWADKFVITDQIVSPGTLVKGNELTVEAGKLRLRAATEPLFGIFIGQNVTPYGDMASATTGYVVKLVAQQVIA
jgi:hypothetical protein